MNNHTHKVLLNGSRYIMAVMFGVLLTLIFGLMIGSIVGVGVVSADDSGENILVENKTYDDLQQWDVIDAGNDNVMSLQPGVTFDIDEERYVGLSLVDERQIEGGNLIQDDFAIYHDETLLQADEIDYTDEEISPTPDAVVDGSVFSDAHTDITGDGPVDANYITGGFDNDGFLVTTVSGSGENIDDLHVVYHVVDTNGDIVDSTEYDIKPEIDGVGGGLFGFGNENAHIQSTAEQIITTRTVEHPDQENLEYEKTAFQQTEKTYQNNELSIERGDIVGTDLLLANINDQFITANNNHVFSKTRTVTVDGEEYGGGYLYVNIESGEVVTGPYNESTEDITNYPFNSSGDGGTAYKPSVGVGDDGTLYGTQLKDGDPSNLFGGGVGDVISYTPGDSSVEGDNNYDVLRSEQNIGNMDVIEFDDAIYPYKIGRGDDADIAVYTESGDLIFNELLFEGKDVGGPEHLRGYSGIHPTMVNSDSDNNVQIALTPVTIDTTTIEQADVDTILPAGYWLVLAITAWLISIIVSLTPSIDSRAYVIFYGLILGVMGAYIMSLIWLGIMVIITTISLILVPKHQINNI